MHDDLNRSNGDEFREDPYNPESGMNGYDEPGQDVGYDTEEGAYDETQNREPFYSEPGDDDIPRWQPRYDQPEPPRPPKRNRWLIPLIIVIVVTLAAIVAGVVIGVGRIKEAAANSKAIAQEEADANTKTSDPGAKISTADVPSVQSGGYILTDVSGIVEETIPAVVSITSRTLIDSGSYGSYWDMFFGRGGYQDQGGGTQEVDSGIGSGTIIEMDDDELLILTSYHVVKDCSSLYVTFYDGKSVDGYIKSQSETEDIAIVAVPLSDISEETFGVIKIATLSDEPVRVGEGVIVIGNALGYGMSVTTGIISATDRQLSLEGTEITALQTDAAINSGNSGGCVLNSSGKIIGISEAKITRSYVEGMCYAIPISIYSGLIQELLQIDGAYTKPVDNGTAQGVYLGIRGRDIDRATASSYSMPQGIYVAATVQGSGAETAGLQAGDVIVGMDNVSFTKMDELQEQLSRHKAGDDVEIIFMREVDGKYTQMKAKVTLSDTIE